MFLEKLFRDQVKSFASADLRIIKVLERNLETMANLPVKYVLSRADVAPSSFYNFLRKLRVNSLRELSKKVGKFVTPNFTATPLAQSSMFKSIKWFLNWNYDNLINSRFMDLITKITDTKTVILATESEMANIAPIYYSGLTNCLVTVEILASETDAVKLLMQRSQFTKVPVIYLGNTTTDGLILKLLQQFANQKFGFVKNAQANDSFVFLHEIKVPDNIISECKPSWEHGFLLTLDLMKHGIIAMQAVGAKN